MVCSDTPEMKSSSEITHIPINCDVPDVNREHKPFLTWDPGRSLISSLRIYQRFNRSASPLASIRKRFAVLAHRFWSAVAGADIPLNSKIGGGLILPHPNGIVIHPDAVIGPNCLIFQQVTIGTRGPGGVPAIGGHVDIGAGAKVLGPIRIGNHVVIGANAVVLQDVPDNCMAVGIPAIVKPLGGRLDQ
jgi:serine O-acetyltransferase